MNTIKELLDKYCPDGVEYKKLGEIGAFERGKNIQKTDFLDEGFPCIHYGQIYTYYKLFTSKTIKFVDTAVASKATIAHPGDVIITTTSENMEDVGTPLGWLGNTGVAISGHSVVFHHHQNTKYITYFIASSSFSEQKKRFARGAKVIDIKATDLEKIEIPVPPLPVQREIVRILDNFTSLEAELEAELEARRKQYEYYRDQLLSFKHLSGGGRSEVEWKTLGEIGDVCMCKRIMKNQTNAERGIPFYKIGTFGKTADAFISEELYEEYKQKYSFPRKGEVLISAAGTIGRAVIYDGEPAYFQDSNIVWIANDETLVLNKYLYYFYSVADWRLEGGTIKRLYNNNLKAVKIPIPPLSTQRRIVSILDRFESLVNDITTGLPAEIAARRQQYEYYRDQLLTFKRKS